MFSSRLYLFIPHIEHLMPFFLNAFRCFFSSVQNYQPTRSAYSPNARRCRADHSRTLHPLSRLITPSLRFVAASLDFEGKCIHRAHAKPSYPFSIIMSNP
jgi:hypothetical protein